MRVALLLFLALQVGLAAATQGVEILWDRYGVAHVYAKNVEGLFFGYGYAQMQSHGDLILKLYGESRGRASEYWGAGERNANLELDRWVLTNDVPERGRQWYELQTPEFRRYLDAFASGMNEYARRHPEKLNAERRVVLPVTGADPVIHTHRILHFSYVSSLARVMAAVTGRPAALSGIGSNAWAIAPAKSASGRSLILMNPHLPWQDWYTYYEIHLNAPGLNLYGASQVGFPVLRFLLSDHLAFTQTVNSSDGSDLYAITPDGQGYRLDGAVRPFEVTEKILRVRGQPDQKLVIRKTVHGPIVWDRDGRLLALRTAGLDRPYALEQYWKMGIARSFSEYEAQLKRLQVPTFNITYADRQGRIMYLFNAAMPLRRQGDLAFWSGIVPGDTSATLWTELHSYEDLPKVIDPPSGFVQNTNDPPWTSTLPPVLSPDRFAAYMATRHYTLRTNRSLAMLTSKEKLSFDDLIAMKHSTRLEAADRLLDDLLAKAAESGNLRAQQAAAVLQQWDRETEAHSRGALLFETFFAKFGEAYRTPLRWDQPLKTPHGIRLAAPVVGQMLEEAASETERNYGALDAPWGEWRRLKRGAKDLPANGATGALGAFRVNSFAGPEPRKYAVTGDTFVLIAEFSRPVRAQALIGYGNATQPGSAHLDDQLPLFAAKKLRPVWRTRREVEANLESRDRF